jgi:hypothetical protein
MRIAIALVAALFVCPLVLVACGGDDEEDAEPFDTLQECYDEHHNTESLSIQKALVVCCLDHPIDGVNPSCGASQAECVGHIDQEIDSSVSAAEIDAACVTYIDEL